MTRTPSAWIVLKFGGTSVSSLANWRNIARVVAARRAAGARVLIVHSAISGITDGLERLLDAGTEKAQEEQLRAIEEGHRQASAAQSIGVTPVRGDAEAASSTMRTIAAGVATGCAR